MYIGVCRHNEVVVRRAIQYIHVLHVPQNWIFRRSASVRVATCAGFTRTVRVLDHVSGFQSSKNPDTYLPAIPRFQVKLSSGSVLESWSQCQIMFCTWLYSLGYPHALTQCTKQGYLSATPACALASPLTQSTLQSLVSRTTRTCFSAVHRGRKIVLWQAAPPPSSTPQILAPTLGLTAASTW